MRARLLTASWLLPAIGPVDAASGRVATTAACDWAAGLVIGILACTVGTLARRTSSRQKRTYVIASSVRMVTTHHGDYRIFATAGCWAGGG